MIAGRSLAGLGLAGLCLLVALALLPGPARAAGSPFADDGMWVWYVSASGGSPKKIARKARRRGIGVVYVKSSDGTRSWSQFSGELVRALHRKGIDACAWSFVYGADPKDEARASARAARAGADCLVIDAEATYEGRYEQAYRYLRALRRRIGDRFPLGLSSFPYVDYHPTFPYSVFMGRGGAEANLPQIYWKAIGTSVRSAWAHTFTWNRIYDRPLFPLGQTWQDPPRRQILNFRRYAREYGARGVSWWSWQETNRREWRLIGRPLHHGVPGSDAPREHPRLRRGDTGDPVLLAQELLRAWGERVRPDGAFGRRMKRAVKSFQAGEGLAVSGRIGSATWKLLRKRDPESTNWRRVDVPRALARALPAARLAPAPSLQGLLPPTMGRP